MLDILARVDWWTVFTGALDIALVYLLIYRLLMLVRGTRAERMLLGLGMIVLVYIVSRALNLATLNWILGNFLGSAILVIVVLFQEDMRRMLMKVGVIPGFGGDTPTVIEDAIREIAHAAAIMSSQRIGALIVIKRDVGLEEYTEHAIQVDGIVSHQLLTSIFHTSSPIHDGAVIVSGNRIVVAGAVLPLTFDFEGNNKLGTRHRAALGLSELTDAVVVVVSEETGTISIIREGRLARDHNEKTLLAALHRLTVFREQRRARFQRKAKSPMTLDSDTELEVVSVQDSKTTASSVTPSVTDPKS